MNTNNSAIRTCFLGFFFIAFLPCHAIRDLPERITRHVLYLAAHSALAETKNLILPTLFSDKSVKTLADSIYENGTICLRVFWKSNQEQILSNEPTCREFVFLLVALYHNLACAKTSYLRGIPWLSLAALYMRLQAIPLNKLFDVLDECLSYYQSIINDYGTPAQSSTTFNEWIVDYWWLPVLITGMAAATFMRWLRARQTKRALKQATIEIESIDLK